MAAEEEGVLVQALLVHLGLVPLVVLLLLLELRLVLVRLGTKAPFQLPVRVLGDVVVARRQLPWLLNSM